jgi:hypothetical protein
MGNGVVMCMVAFQVLHCNREMVRIFVVSDVPDNGVPFDEAL